MSTPQTTIYVCYGVHLDNRYEHSIYFPNATAQQEYFAGKVYTTFPAYSYVRKSWPLQVQATMEQARNWSYLYFRNGSGKYYYYFINQIEYKNDNMVELTLEMDVIQTYLFDFQMMDCFIERQHTVTDAVGEHTLDEGLECGELKEFGAENWTNLNELCILVLASINPNHWDTDESVESLGYMYDNVFSGLSVWAVDSADWADWTRQLAHLSDKGYIDGIVAMWMYPKSCVVLGGENTWSDDSLCKVVKSTNKNGTFTYSKGGSSPFGFTPKNNKLMCYPYRSLYATNNQGGCAVFRFERFGTPSSPKFNAVGSVSPDGTVKMYPDDYNGVTSINKGGATGTDCNGNFDYGLSLGNFPSCAWNADMYKLWLAQNQNQLQHSQTAGILTIAGGVAAAAFSAYTGNMMGVVGGVGAVVGGAQQIGGIMAQKKDMAVQPPQSRGGFSSSVNVVANTNTFTFYTKHIDKEHAKAIDDYFTMYGYKINRVQKPNLCARPAFTYIKTVGCNISGNTGSNYKYGPWFCTEDRVKITSIFDKGITFWVNGDRIADYSQNNAV